MRVLVCGGRDFRDKYGLFKQMDALRDRVTISLLIEGGQVSTDSSTGERYGADYLAARWADSRQIPIRTERADWALHGRSAGPKRNRLMLEKWSPQLVVAFPGGKGTANMVAQARGLGVDVLVIGVGGSE